MPPDTARTQQAALERVQRLQAKEDKARKRYEQDKTKSDSTLKSLAAKAAKDGAAKKKLEELNGGKGDRKEGTPASGPVQGGKGMGPHKKNPVGDKSTKEAAKWTAKLAAASKKSQLPPEVPGANEAPQVATDGGKGAEGGGAGAAAGGGGGGGAAGAAAGGAAGGAGSTQKAKELTNAPPSEYAVKISETGKKITDEAKSEISAKNEAMPVFSAEMKGEDAKEKKGGKLNGLDASMGTGVDGADAAAPNLKKEARIRTGKGKPGSDIKGAGTDAETAALKSLFSASLNKISDHSSTNTSPGPSPTVQFGGTSDPMRGNRAQQEAIQKQDAAYVEAVKAVDSGPGPEQVQPLELKEDIPAANAELPPIPDVPTPAEAQAYIDKGHASDVYDKADELQKSNFDEALAEAESQFEQAGDQMNADHATKVDEASKAVDEENKKAQAEQEAQVTKARADIDKGQKDTKKKQEKELVKAKRKGDKEKKAVQGKIEKRRKDDDKKINKKYKEAEKKAAAKKKAAEKKAAAKKKAAEKKKSDESWWSRAASAVGSFIDSVANAVSGIFDAMAKAVGDILNKVKDLATSMIDAAISFASSALDILGDKLKGLVDSLLGDIFPGLAAALNELIDQAVNIAKDAVNAVGEQLKAAVTAAIDTLNSGIQAVINAYKTAVTTALAIASAVASGDWEAAFKAMLEGALSLAGIDPSAFYGLVGDGMDTINAIIDDPMSFVSNMIGAVGQGFGQFADNFGSHLMNGAVEWLTGGLAEAGITLPETWDAAGIFGMIADILGVSFDKLKDKIGERIGEDNVAMLESIWGYVEAAMNGGIAGLWEHAKGQLGDLWAGLLDSAITMLTEQIITAAVMKIATMWNPAGAIVQALITVWNVYNFIQEQAQRIMGLVRSVVDSMSNIVQGQLGQAANFIEGSLADLVPVAISLLANLLGLGGISKKVKGIIEEIQAQVDKAIDWVLDKLFELGKAAFEALKSTMKGGGNEDPAAEQKAAEEQQPEQPRGGDPAKLPGLTLATVIGAMELGWDAVQGGQGATSTLTGKFAGKVGAQSIDAMQAEADKMEGPGKAEASKYISIAKTQVLAVDSRGGKWIRGETDEIAPIKESHDLLGTALLRAANALGNETGGDKPASEQSHKQIAETMKRELEGPVDDSVSFEDATRTKQQTAQQLAQRFTEQVEPDVQVRVEFNQSNDAADNDIDMTIVIAPNTTELGVSAVVGASGPVDAKLANLQRPEADHLQTLIMGNAPMVAAISGKTEQQVRADGHGLWKAGGDKEYVESAAAKSSDATGKRKVNQIAQDTQLPGALKTEYYREVADALLAQVSGSTAPMNLYDALKGPLSDKAKYLCKGADFVFNTRSLWRGEGLDGTFTGSLGNGLRRTWKTAVEADIASDPAQVAAWAGLNDGHKTILARELFKKEAGEGRVRKTQVIQDVITSGGSLDSRSGPTWWTDTDINIDFSTTESGVPADQARFEHWCKMLALQPSWYTGGLMKFGVNSDDLKSQLKKPTVLDGMMSEYWVQAEENKLAGMTGGGATEWVARGVPASNVDDVEFAATGNTYDDSKARWLAAGAGAAPEGTAGYAEHVAPGKAATNDYDRQNQAYSQANGWSNEAMIQGNVDPSIQAAHPEATARNEQIAAPTRQRQANSQASGGANAGEWSAAAIDSQIDSHGPDGQSSRVPGEMSSIPTREYVDADGERHIVFITGTGSNPSVHRASNDPKPVKGELRKHGKAFTTAGDIEKLAKEFMKPQTSEERARIKRDIENKLEDLKKEMARARNEDSEMVQKRLKLEKKLGMFAFNHADSNGTARDMASKAMKIMETQAKDAMAKAKNIDAALITNADLNKDEGFRAAIKKTGMNLGSGFFGAVGKSFDTIRTVFNSGNLRETVQHVVNWGNQWAKQFFTTAPKDLERLLKEAGVVRAKIDEYLQLQAKLLVENGGQPKGKAPDKANKKVFKDTTDNDEYRDAKKSEMDRKFPYMPLELLPREELLVIARRHGQKPRETTPTERILKKLQEKQKELRAKELDKKGESYITPGMAPRGEPNPMTQSKTDRDTAGIGFSNREAQAHGLNDDVLPFLEGFTANMVDENNEWIQAAHELDVPLRAGISGTTNRWMMLASQLGANLPGARLAMLGHLIPTNAHSWHEIMVAAQGHVPYPKQGVYVPLTPLSENDLRDLAKQAGATGEEVDVVLGLKKV